MSRRTRSRRAPARPTPGSAPTSVAKTPNGASTSMKTAHAEATRNITNATKALTRSRTASGVASCAKNVLCHLMDAHDGVRRLADRERHRVRGDEAGDHEGEVGGRTLELVGVGLDEPAEQDAHRHDVEQRREEVLTTPPRQVRLRTVSQ